MSRRYGKSHERELIDIVNNRNNLNKCGECGSDYPTWALWNLGILLCGRCANIHKKILSSGHPRGGPISKVKSLTLETWTDDQIELLRRVGNKKAKQKWNPKRVPFPHDDDDDFPIEEYLRDKYVFRKFRDDVDLDDDDKFSRYSDGSGALTPAARSRLSTVNGSTRLRANSRQIPRLLHRKLTTFEQTQYQSQVHHLAQMGYSNRDAVLESLILSNGDIDFALDILDHDAKVNPALTETPPELPKRPSQAASRPGQYQLPNLAGQGGQQSLVSPDWWTGAQQPQAQPQVQPQSQAMGQPQIYQYSDPVTGQISYIDQNGQQYLDPNNPQHQQLLNQQTNPQLIAQQTSKQNIMSLYNQPNNFTTNVAVANQPGHVTLQQQLQPQLQQPTNQQIPQQQLQQQPTNYAFGNPVYMQPTVQQQTGAYGQQVYGQPQQQYWR